MMGRIFVFLLGGCFVFSSLIVSTAVAKTKAKTDLDSTSSLTAFDLARGGKSRELNALLKLDPTLINKVDSDGYPLFYYALDNEHQSLGLELLKKTDLQIKIGPGKDSVLVMSIFKNCEPCVVWLLKKQPNLVQGATADGFTPLMYAARSSTLKIVQALVASGAAINHKNSFGKSALDLARKSQNEEVVRWLEGFLKNKK